MSTSLPETDARATDLGFNDDDLWVDLADGRRLSVPLAWFPRLLRATPAERDNWEFLGDGQGVHWPEIDEDLSVEGLLRGSSASDRSKQAG
ncbi:MAG: DUF2442 domain-containing protein [Planctomycetota bacterium]|nr:MAG: DUF2442 domain-containing protein [Planctomycetota bacterium]